MSISQIVDLLPDYARDLKLNLSSVMSQAELTEQQTWTVAVACALASRNDALTNAVLSDAQPKLSPEQLYSAKAAFAVMGMNNIFYRFRHFMSSDDYNNVPARLRMQAIRNHGGDPVDFELACLAVSSINGCEMCVKAHEKVVRDKGLTAETVMASVRIASTFHAVAGVLDSVV